MAVAEESGLLQLYSDPECRELRAEMAKVFGVNENNVMMVNRSEDYPAFSYMAIADDKRPHAFRAITNGSDHADKFANMAFGDYNRPIALANLINGFYPVFSQLNHISYTEIPLKSDFSIDPDDYVGIGKTVVIANPNAPTGLALGVDEIERIVRGNPDNVVIIDEAYVDFGGDTVLSLIKKYDNLLVIGTFSKSRSLAGARLGFAFGCEALISDLYTIRYST